jgi:hypothetical protein
MYKALHTQTGEEIIILHPLWLKRIDDLRAMDQADWLVCQGCRQPLRVKAGELKRPHFAHKHLQACSYGTESPEILNARAELYGWLLERSVKPVTLEKDLPGSGLPRPIDCWVENGAESVAYWIIETGIKLEPREGIRKAFQDLGIHIQTIFLHSMLSEKEIDPQSVLLTPTERTFMASTPFDAAIAAAGEAGFSLHYFDADRKIMTTYRGLILHHRPNWYKGLKKSSPLQNVQASPVDGGFIHPGELERLAAYQQKQRRLEAKRARFQERDEAWEQRLAARRATRETEDTWGLPGRSQELEAQAMPPLPCAICGQVTSDYWSTFSDASGHRLCRCRECLPRP